MYVSRMGRRLRFTSIAEFSGWDEDAVAEDCVRVLRHRAESLFPKATVGRDNTADVEKPRVLQAEARCRTQSVLEHKDVAALALIASATSIASPTSDFVRPYIFAVNSL